jgi:hypothetical protein
MGGLEGLINILDSEGGFGSLDMQVDNFWIHNFDYIVLYLSLTSKLASFPRSKQLFGWIAQQEQKVFQAC